MRLGTVTSAPAVRNASRVDGLSGSESVTPVRKITPDWVDEDPLDELTQSDRDLLGHLYGEGDEHDPAAAAVSSLAREINRERASGMVSDHRDLTTEDVRRMIGRLTFTAKEPVPVEVQLRIMTMLNGSTQGRLDVVL
ncbi:hypothetical protein [Kineococcus rhizosphaerae]|uniref:Uncharacterized protein n=1 Tax=Kineococcus rhizosphaerae TaxID=559628 RepID=A0A2T0QUZ1_9ACTN|nr:hypothetical protein [Kineococcus rhizosphaerae]PRY09076.1 hypothetical protein CLV37_12116 [Kineococcus rhizosphaerae]